MPLTEIKKLASELISATYTFTINSSGKTYSLSPKNDLDYYFRFDNAKRRLGCCDYGSKVISLSKPLCLANLDKVNTQIKDTILHEIAHALCVEVYGARDGRGHDYRWRGIALQIGCDGERCYSGDNIEDAPSKYTLRCPTCNTTQPKHRKPSRGRRYACGKCCNGRFVEKHVFIIEQNY